MINTLHPFSHNWTRTQATADKSNLKWSYYLLRRYSMESNSNWSTFRADSVAYIFRAKVRDNRFWETLVYFFSRLPVIISLKTVISTSPLCQFYEDPQDRSDNGREKVRSWTETSRGPIHFTVSASAPGKDTRMQCRPNNSEYVIQTKNGLHWRLPIQINTPA